MFITTEAVGAGHPDKICDQIADNILDKFLEKDKNAKVACEVFASHKDIFIAGEVTTTSYVDVVKAAWEILYKYGYNEEDFSIHTLLHDQSEEIKQKVERNDKEIGAGDQGIMFGYATNETPSFMPLTYVLAQEILKKLESLRVKNKIPWLKSDMKSQVTMDYSNDVVKVNTIVLSIQHDEKIEYKKFAENIKKYAVVPLIKKYKLNNDYILKINPNGSFIEGGPVADSGLTGRKIVVDTYGAHAHHGGGSFSGKDYTKPDRSVAYAARWIAKNIVAAKIAQKCEVQLAYIIGDYSPISINVNTFNTGKISDTKIVEVIKKVFPLKLSEIISNFNMKSIKYLPLSVYGHFGRTEFDYEWENINMVKSLKENI